MSPRNRRPLPRLLQQHRQVGKALVPPLMQHAPVTLTDWLRDDLPDFLWPALLVVEHGDAAARRLTDLQQAWLDHLASIQRDPDNSRLDGRLTSLAQFPEDLLRLLNSEKHKGCIPKAMQLVCAAYPKVPGAWAFDRQSQITDQALDDLLNSVLQTIVSCGQRSGKALVVCIPFAWLMLQGKVSLSGETAELLKPFPLNQATRSAAEAVLCSAYGATVARHDLLAEDATGSDEIVRWVKEFWATNWNLSPCLLDESDEVESLAADLISATQADARIKVRDLWGFLEKLTFEIPVDLHEPSRHEVVLAIAARCVRSVHALVESPLLWGGEHGSVVIRNLAEAEIVIRWLIKRDDPSLFLRFVEYGEGKQKLMRAHVQEYLDELGDQAPQLLRDMASYLDNKPHIGGVIDSTTVSVDSSFAGVNTRKMAEEIDDLGLYNHVFQPMSAAVHGEWSALDNYVLGRCINPLHCFHRIPLRQIHPLQTQDTVTAALNHLNRVLDIARAAVMVVRSKSELDVEQSGNDDDSAGVSGS